MDNYWEKVFKESPNYYMDLDNPSRLEIVKYIGDNDTILELGCGGGALKALLPNHKYLGVDYSETAIKIATERFGDEFEVADVRDLSSFKDNGYDIVVMRHFLENQQDWSKTVEEAFRIANKKVILVLKRLGDMPTTLIEDNNNDTWVWDINYGEFNMLARGLSVNVSYGKVGEEDIIIIGKHLDEVVFDLDDFYDTNNGLDILDTLKTRFPKLKVSVFCILSKCNPSFIKKTKAYKPWMQFCLHGDLHDTEHGTAQETNYWTYDQMSEYLDKAESLGCYEKVFRAPGWNINYEAVKCLVDRGYIIAEHLGHDRWEEELGGKRYTTGHLMEVHGHVQNVNMNGLEELASTKCNFSENTEFYFITETPLDKHLPNRYQ